MKIKNIIQKIIIAVGIVSTSMLLVGTAFATYVPQNRNLCALSIHPYDPSATGGNILSATDTSWFNLFDQTSPFCTSHLVYPNQYSPQPPLKTDNPLVTKSDVETKKAPETLHNHAYFNDSVQDDYFYYKSFVDKFQIILEDDALTKTDKMNPVCYHYNNSGSLITTPKCNGHDSGWGGTQITYNSTTGVAQWEFGVDSNPKSGRPVIYGKNPDLTGLGTPAMPDTTNENNRIFNPWIKLTSNNNPEEIWSATTTSRVLVRDQAILKTAVNTSSAPTYGNLFEGACNKDGENLNDQNYSKWCTLPTPTASTIIGVEGSERVGGINGKDYYWFKIGIVGTIWKKPPPPLIFENVCTNLGLTVDGVTKSSVVTVGPNTKSLLKVTPVNTPPNPTPPANPTTAQWTQSGDGALSFGPTSISINTLTPGSCTTPSASFSAPIACDYFYTTPATGNGTVTVKAVPNATNPSIAACSLPINFSAALPPPLVCTNLTVTYPTPNQVCVAPNPPGTISTYNWTVNGTPSLNHSGCQSITPSDSWTVIAPESPICNAFRLVPKLPPPTPPPTPPRFEKTVRAISLPESKYGEKSGSNPLTLIPSLNGKVVEYKLIFTPTSPNTSAQIVDEIGKGFIQGTTNIGTNGGRIVYNGNLSVSVQPCTSIKAPNPKINCYEGSDLSGIHLVKVNNQVTITYQGKIVDSQLTVKNCTENKSNICAEKYPNSAKATYSVYKTPIDTVPALTGGPLRGDAVIQSFCQYLLTRAAGDIYLETDLKFGKDINICSEYKTSTGLIITPNPLPPATTPKTGANTTVSIGHEVCSNGQAGKLSPELAKLYGKDAASANLSSQICEVKLRPGKSWTKSQITSSIQENTTRVARWTPNLNGYNAATLEDLITHFGKNTSVYHKTSGDLDLGGYGQDLIFHDGDGTKTFIVEGHDLYIHNNIKYGDCNKTLCTVRDTASLAFIVLGGNVYIDPDVTEVAGVFFVQQSPGRDSGKIKAINGSDSFEKLTFTGSVYGDIEDLFKHRKFAGDPAANNGSVVIRFDERIILNTPPGLKDLLQLTQKQVAS